MIQAVENYMSNHGITMTDVSKNSGISGYVRIIGVNSK